MREKEILERIQALDSKGDMEAIVQYVEMFPQQEQTPLVISELAAAYCNLYWQDPCQEKQMLLVKAVKLLESVKQELENNYMWNYRIGYAYFYLDQKELSKKYLTKFGLLFNLRNTLYRNPCQEYINYIDIAKRKNITAEEALQGGKAGVQYLIEEILEEIKKQAPEVYKQLIIGDLTQYENLTRDIDVYFSIVKGQKTNNLLINNRYKILSIEQAIEQRQKMIGMLNHLEKSQWKSQWRQEKIQDKFSVRDYSGREIDKVKNCLYNEMWIPVLAGENELICIDLDPEEGGEIGQIISVLFGAEKEDFELSLEYGSIKEMLKFLLDGLKIGAIEENYMGYLDFDKIVTNYIWDYSTLEKKTLEKYVEINFGEIKDVIKGTKFINEDGIWIDDQQWDDEQDDCQGYDQDDESWQDDDFQWDGEYDLYVVKNKQFNFYSLITFGMGAQTMNLNELRKYPNPEFERVELMINLPLNWDFYRYPEKYGWIIPMIRAFSRIPNMQDVVLQDGFVINFGWEDEETGISGFLLKSVTRPVRFNMWERDRIGFLNLIPLYKEEIEFQRKYGSQRLFSKIAKVMPKFGVLSVGRKNTCQDFGEK